MSLSSDTIVSRLLQGDMYEPKKRLQNISTAMVWIQQQLVRARTMCFCLCVNVHERACGCWNGKQQYKEHPMIVNFTY